MLARAPKQLGIHVGIGRDQSGGLDSTLRNEAAELSAPFQHIARFLAVAGRAIKGSLDDFLIGQRNIEARAELAQLALVELFLLMGDVAAFAGLAETVAFDRF